MKIAILGYGKMGRLVEAVALREGCEIGPILDLPGNAGGREITRERMSGVDVAIDFSQPEAVLPNIEAAARAGLNLVVGTTGWQDQLARAEKAVHEGGIGLVHASNFSLGVNLFFEIAAHAAGLIGRLPAYDPYIVEEHHRAKKDAPSGTALSLLEVMKPHLARLPQGIASVRAGSLPGTHTVGFDSEADTIVLEHRARSRQGFAEGAVLAARWIAGRRGLFNFREVFREILAL